MILRGSSTVAYKYIRLKLDVEESLNFCKKVSPVLELPLFPRRVFIGLRAINGGRYLISKNKLMKKNDKYVKQFYRNETCTFTPAKSFIYFNSKLSV